MAPQVVLEVVGMELVMGEGQGRDIQVAATEVLVGVVISIPLL